MPTVSINNTKIYYTDIGNKNAPPIIFIHGFPFSHEMWDPQIDIFRDTHRIICYDIRGHGKSEQGDGHYLIDFFVDDLFALMDHLEIYAANIVGLSMGGYIALRGIEREPDRFQSLVLCDTKSEADSNEAKIKRAAAINTILTEGVEKFADGFLKSVFAPDSFDKRPEAVRKIRKIIEATSPAVLCNTLIALAARTDTTDNLSNINVPTLVLVGEHDQLTPPSASEGMVKRIKNAELYVLEDAAHMSNLENTEKFNFYLQKFFE